MIGRTGGRTVSPAPARSPRLATLQAIVLPVFAEPYLVESLADNAILVALASIFNLVAYRAMETFSHGRE